MYGDEALRRADGASEGPRAFRGGIRNALTFFLARIRRGFPSKRRPSSRPAATNWPRQIDALVRTAGVFRAFPALYIPARESASIPCPSSRRCLPKAFRNADDGALWPYADGAGHGWFIRGTDRPVAIMPGALIRSEVLAPPEVLFTKDGALLDRSMKRTPDLRQLCRGRRCWKGCRNGKGTSISCARGRRLFEGLGRLRVRRHRPRAVLYLAAATVWRRRRAYARKRVSFLPAASF